MAPRKKSLPVLEYKAIRLSEKDRDRVEHLGPINDIPFKENWYCVVRSEQDGREHIDALLGESLFNHFFGFIDVERPSSFALVYEKKYV